MPDYIAQYRIYLEQEKHASANTVSSYIRDVTQIVPGCRRAVTCAGSSLPPCPII